MDASERRPLQDQIDTLRGRVTYAIDLEKTILAMVEAIAPGNAAKVHAELADRFSRKPEDEHAARGYGAELESLERAIHRQNQTDQPAETR